MRYFDESFVEYCFRKSRGWLEMMCTRIPEEIFERRFSQRPERPA